MVLIFFPERTCECLFPLMDNVKSEFTQRLDNKSSAYGVNLSKINHESDMCLTVLTAKPQQYMLRNFGLIIYWS